MDTEVERNFNRTAQQSHVLSTRLTAATLCVPGCLRFLREHALGHLVRAVGFAEFVMNMIGIGVVSCPST